MLFILVTMRRFKIIVSTSILFFTMAFAVVFNACTKDLCDDLICKNNGVCRDGRCKCGLGYEGVNCEYKMYEKFVGTWDGSYRCNGLVPDLITNIIAPGDKPNAIVIYDIFDQGTAINATVDLEKILIETQVVGDNTFSGNGRIEGKYITVFIEQKNVITGQVNSCVYNATKFTQP